MNKKDLDTFFREHMVPPALYSIGQKEYNKICLEDTSDGWEVYFSDANAKVGVLHYDTEDAACHGMMDEIRKCMESFYGLTWNLSIA